jgi:hypothetical protein
MTAEPRFHPACLLLPEMGEAEFRELVEDIRNNGQREPIRVLQDGRVFDGRHRLRACRELGIEPKVSHHAPPYDEAELDRWVIEFVVSANLARRHLSTDQRAAIAAELANMKSGHRTDLGPVGPRSGGQPLSNAAAARLMKVSERSVKRAKQRMRTDPAAHALAKAGKRPKAKPKDRPRPPTEPYLNRQGYVMRRPAPARAIADPDQWRNRFRELVGALVRLKMAQDRDEHAYHREMVEADPTFRLQVMEAFREPGHNTIGQALQTSTEAKAEPQPAPDDLRERLRSVLTRLEMSETRFAKHAGIPQPSLNRFMLGQGKTSRANRAKIEEALADLATYAEAQPVAAP